MAFNTHSYTRNFRKVMGFIAISLWVLISLQYFGVFTRVLEKDFYTDFHYPMDGDVNEYIMQLRAKQKPSVPPINVYNYSFISNCEHKCKNGDLMEQLHLVYIVKSAAKNFERRKAIRKTWGFENRFSDVPIRRVFILGIQQYPSELQSNVDAEKLKYNDIVQAKFLDSHFNNTIKTMIGFRWAVTYCSLSKFYMFTDDDMYISNKNVLNFVQIPTKYPNYLIPAPNNLIPEHINGQESSRLTNTINGIHTEVNTIKLHHYHHSDLADNVKLFAGFVSNSVPHRDRGSERHVSLSEYPYTVWPPHVMSGAFLVSREALIDMHYASYYTKHFHFDDVYLGLIAKQAGIVPLHCEEFHFGRDRNVPEVASFTHVVASNGFSDPRLLARVWNEQAILGNV